jgi:uncharacterized protein (UPF0335 family)
MRRSVGAILGVAAVIMLVCILILATKYRQQSAQYAMSQKSEEAVRTQFNAALQSIAEIQDSLTAISPEETRLRGLSQGAETGGQVTETQKEQMLDRISVLKESIKNTNMRIRDLEKKLKGSQTEVAGLRRIIDNLKKAVADREETIQILSTRVDQLTVTVSGLQKDVARGEQKISQQKEVLDQNRVEMGTIYYVVGKKDDLKKKGIIADTGGVIGLGKSTQLSGAFRGGDFTAFDTNQGHEISITGREPVVLSAQTKSSYDLSVGETSSTLRIRDVVEFRKVKYLVIMVK